MDATHKKIIITIDGPAGSGKSTTARNVARRLGYLYLDSGALYRAITLAALERQVDFTNPDALVRIAENVTIVLEPDENELIVRLDGVDVTQAIRLPRVTQAIGPVAANAGVRKALLKQQRSMAAQGGIVAEGRDMGTVVFPEADLKFFLIASIAARAQRRMRELEKKGIHIDLDTLIQEIRKRDDDDSSRDVSPLRKPNQSIEIDTTGLSIEQQVDHIVRIAVEYGAREV